MSDTHLQKLAELSERQRKVNEGTAYIPINWYVRASKYGFDLNDISTNIFLQYYSPGIMRIGKSIKIREPLTYRQTHLRFEKDVEGIIDNIVSGQDNWEYEFFGSECTNAFFNSYHDAANVMNYIFNTYKTNEVTYGNNLQR